MIYPVKYAVPHIIVLFSFLISFLTLELQLAYYDITSNLISESGKMKSGTFKTGETVSTVHILLIRICAFEPSSSPL